MKKKIDKSVKDARKIDRLHRLIEAILSVESDSHFNKTEIRYRQMARWAQDYVFGSREILRERLTVARCALAHYAKGADAEPARVALIFIDEKTAR